MSETTWPESTDKPPVGAKRELIGLIVLLSYLAALIVFFHWKGHTWPTQVNSPWCKSVNSRPSEIGFWFGDRIWMRREAGRFGVSLRSRADFGR